MPTTTKQKLKALKKGGSSTATPSKSTATKSKPLNAAPSSKELKLRLRVADTKFTHVVKIFQLDDSEVPLPQEKTLVIVGLPLTLDALVPDMFENFGEIDSYVWNQGTKQSSGSDPNCFVTFSEATTLKKILKKAETTIISVPSGSTFPVVGWLNAYTASYPEPSDLQPRIDRALFDYDQEQYRKRKEQDATIGQVDEDGFILVQKRGRRAISDGKIHVSGVSADKVVVKEKAPLKDFYRFQKLERKKNHLTQLREKFEEDKARIARLKTERRFRPY